MSSLKIPIGSHFVRRRARNVTVKSSFLKQSLLIPVLLIWGSIYAYNLHFYLYLYLVIGVGIIGFFYLSFAKKPPFSYLILLIPVLILIMGKIVNDVEHSSRIDTLSYALSAGEKQFLLTGVVTGTSREVVNKNHSELKHSNHLVQEKHYSTLLEGELLKTRSGLWLPTHRTIRLVGATPKMVVGERITVLVKISVVKDNWNKNTGNLSQNSGAKSGKMNQSGAKLGLGDDSRESLGVLTSLVSPREFTQREQLIATLSAPITQRKPPAKIAAFSNWLKEEYYAFTREYPYLSALGSAVLLGQKENLSWQWQEDFKTSGIYHLVCLSGMHVGILLSIFQLLPVSRKNRIGGAIGGLIIYIGIVGPSPSLLRAVSMGIIAGIGVGINRGKNALNALMVTVVIWLFINPNLAYDYGFILSVLATYVILVRAKKNLLLTEKIYAFGRGILEVKKPGMGFSQKQKIPIACADKSCLESKTSVKQAVVRASKTGKKRKSKRNYKQKILGLATGKSGEKILKSGINIMVTTTIVQLCCYPIMLHLRGGINPFSVLANFLSAPLLPVIMWISLSICGWVILRAGISLLTLDSYSGDSVLSTFGEICTMLLEQLKTIVDYLLDAGGRIGDFASFLVVKISHLTANLWVVPWPEGQAGGNLFLLLLGSLTLLMIKYNSVSSSRGKEWSLKSQAGRM